MCLAIPAVVKSIEGKEAEVETGGIRRKISIWLTPDVRVGDYVLVHAGYAINIVDRTEAEETIKLFQKIGELESRIETDQ